MNEFYEPRPKAWAVDCELIAKTRSRPNGPVSRTPSSLAQNDESCMCGKKKGPFDFLKYCYEPIYLPPQTIESQMSWLLQLLRPEFVLLGSFSKRFNLTWHHVRRPTWRHINHEGGKSNYVDSSKVKKALPKKLWK
jgi:hypothetical protein